MAFGAGKNGVIKVDDAGGGSLQDISAYVTSVKQNTSQGIYDTTVLGATSKGKLLGFADWSLDLEGIWDPTLDGYFGVTDSTTRSVEYYPAGTSVGPTKPKYSGEALKVGYVVNDPVDGVVTWSATLEGSGALGRATS